MAQTTVTKKREETNTNTQSGTVAQNLKEVFSISETFPSTWSNSIDKIFASYNETENTLLETLESQKATWEKLTSDLTQLGEEQKKLYVELQELVILNIQKVFGPEATKPLEQWNAQVEEVNNRIKQLTEAPYKEGLNFINQAQEQFQQLAKESIAQQQKVREDVKNEIKSATKVFLDLYESNINISLSFFK